MTQQDIMPGKPLAELLQNKWLPSDVGDATVSGLCLDHRYLASGDLFIAIAGTRNDGRCFIKEAINAGAAAVLKEADNEEEKIRWSGAVPIIPYVGLAEDVSAIAGEFFGQPSRGLNVIGVTGTNGKSTCTHLVAQLYRLLGSFPGNNVLHKNFPHSNLPHSNFPHSKKAAVMGTLGYGLLDATATNGLIATGLTTADPITNQRILAELKDSGADTVAMEVSSHSLDQHRVADITFAAALFTNLTRDHLDYHGDMERYGLAKKKLFRQAGLRNRVLNLDDAFGRQLTASFKKNSAVKTWTYSLTDTNADLYMENIEHRSTGVRGELNTPWGKGEINTILLGDFNLSNLLGVIAVCCAQGNDLQAVLQAVPALKPVAGRMEQVPDAGELNVIVDYAHTPDSLEQVLKALRAHTTGRLHCVFGCGGDRDKGKRPLMAGVAERLADVVTVTSDNPRTETQAQIARDIRAGFRHPDAVTFVDDRSLAIKQVIAQARAGDCILIAGKGHETYQQVGENRVLFSDVKQARLALQARKLRRRQGVQN
jgi:UDP-N-acetylmuramoyl-L-alanyl-D-glutamate--2,6-diaminopimelate ligase